MTIITKSAFLLGEDKRNGEFTPTEVHVGQLNNQEKADKILHVLKNEVTPKMLFQLWNIGYCLGTFGPGAVVHVQFAQIGGASTIKLLLYPNLLMVVKKHIFQEDMDRLSLLILKNGLKVAIESEISVNDIQEFIEQVYHYARKESLMRKGDLVYQKAYVDVLCRQ